MKAHVLVVVFVVAGAATAQQPGSWNWHRSMLSPPAWNPMVAYDEVRQRGVLFGGEGQSSSLFQETWEWDGRDWRERVVPTTSTPPPRYSGRMAWDPVNQRVLLFGGGFWSAYPGVFNDTWLWNGFTWTQVATPMAPPARVYHQMATDPLRQRIVLFGGRDWAGEFTDTWEWNGTQWAQMQPLTRSPAPHWQAAMAWNPVTQRVALFGGTAASVPLLPLDEWNGLDWVARSGAGGLQPTGVDKAFAVPDPAGLGVRIYGWRSYGLATPTAHQWLWNGTTMSGNQTVSTVPPPGNGLLDTARNEVVLSPSANRSTWVQNLNTNAWSARTVIGGSSSRWFRSFVHLPWRDAYVGTTDVIGTPLATNVWLRTEVGMQDLGLAPTTGAYGIVVHPGTREMFWLDGQNRLWLYHWPGWTLTPITVPGSSGMSVLGFDSLDRGVWCAIQGSLYKWYGAAFTLVTTPPFSILGGVAAAFDADRLVLAVHPPGALWEWNGASWTTHPSPATALSALAHVPGHGLLLLEGRRVWEWDGSGWTQHVTTQILPADIGAFYALYDPARRRVRTLVSRTIYTFEDIWDLQFEELTATPNEPHPGNTVQFQVDSLAHAGQPWVLAVALNTYPAIPLAGFHPEPVRVLPLTADYLFRASVANGLTGFLDAQGRAQISWTLPAGPELLGLRLFTCAVSITPTWTAGLVSNPVEIYIGP